MLAVRVPDEIRKYKEKVAFGMTGRQIICLGIMLGVCVPLYWFGRKAIPGNVLGWLIMLIALPIGAVGFIRISGMPFEKFVMVILRSELLYPKKRKYHSDNAWRDWQNEQIKLEQPHGRRAKKKAAENRRDASFEKAFLLAEAEEEGNTGFDLKGARLLTVSADEPRNEKEKRKKAPKEKSGKEKNSRKAERGREVEERMRTDPNYAPGKRDLKDLKEYKQSQAARAKEIKKGEAPLKKRNAKMEKRRKVKTSLPKSTQDSIPYIADYEEGMFEVQPNKYSKMYALKDINYKTAHEDDQVAIFCKLGEFINYFGEDMRFSFCVDNRVISRSEQEQQVFKRMRGDRYDRHRQEYNNIIRRQIIAGRNDMQVQKYVTVTIDADSPIEALLRFHKVDAEVAANLRRLGSDAKVLTTSERLSYFHDKYRRGYEGEFRIDYDFIKQQGISTKDYIAPSYMKFDRATVEIEDGLYRVLYLNNLPASLSDEFLFDLCDNEFPTVTTIAVEPVAQDKALKLVRRQLTGIEADKLEAEKKAIKSGYSPDTIQHSIKDAYSQAEMLYDDMMNKDQKLFFVTILMMVYGADEKELKENCDVVMSKARRYTTQLQTLTEQQEEGYKTVLPFGYVSPSLAVDRALTTESTAIFMPFSNQELFQSGGFYYGLNQISQNLIIVNRTRMKTPSGFVLGSSGSGKSFATKREILNVLLEDDETNVLIIDPENEYGDFCRAFGGTVLKISSTSDNYINPLDMPPDYGLDEDDDPDTTPLSVKKDKALKKKSDYVMSIIERMISVGGGADSTSITPVQKTIVDSCLRETYKDYLDSDFDYSRTPTLLDLQDAFDRAGKQSDEARQIAEGVAYYTRGSMNVFAHRTNVRIGNRLVVFNVRDLGGQLQQIGQIIVFDFIWNRMVENRSRGIRTYCYCDEIHTMFRSYYSADYLNQLYKRGRKYGLVITGITQDVEDLLVSEKARGMISNSDFIMMLNQSSENLKILAGMLSISETQMGFVSGADAGSGLLFAEKVIVPFADRFPSDSYLYRLMSTKFGEEMTREEVDREISLIMQDSSVEAPPTDEEIEERVSATYGRQLPRPR